jgi:hypothetical protein
MATCDAFRPAHLADTLKAFRVINQIIDLEHCRSMRFSLSLSKTNRG